MRLRRKKTVQRFSDQGKTEVFFPNLKSFFFLIPHDDGKSYIPHHTACTVVCVYAVYINLQCVFFCSARVEYFSNESFISDSDHHMNEQTHTHTHMPSETSIWKLNQAGDRGLAEAKGHTHAYIYKNTQTKVTHTLIQSTFVFQHSLSSANILTCLYTNLKHITARSPSLSLFVLMSHNSQTPPPHTHKKTHTFPGTRNMEGVKTKSPKTAQTSVCVCDLSHFS